MLQEMYFATCCAVLSFACNINNYNMFDCSCTCNDKTSCEITTPYSIEYIMSQEISNNNPGGIRISSTTWEGEISSGEYTDFCTFKSLEYGYRALLKLLQNYRIKYNCKTVRDFIERWAPNTENNTEWYIDQVCEYCGWSEQYEPDIYNESDMIKFAKAISKMETGKVGDTKIIKRGWQLL